MNNTGNFSTYLGYVILTFIILPTFFRLLGELFSCFRQQQPIQYEEVEQAHLPPLHIHNHCCGNQTNDNKPSKHKKPKNKKPKSKSKDLNAVFGLQQIDSTPPEISEAASQALKKLGFKISEARRIVKKLCIKQRYDNEVDIIRDAFSFGNRP